MKYIVKFSKKDRMAYISHLDLQRLFIRVFRIIDVKPAYTQGYNPHPKLGFVLPLTLGFTSDSEYIELVTEEDGYNVDEIKNKANRVLPEGISILYVKEDKRVDKKKLASIVSCSAYDIVMPPIENIEQLLNEFLGREEIIYTKVHRKTKKEKQIDIRPMIYNATFKLGGKTQTILSVLLKTDNEATLNPKVFMEAFTGLSNLEIEDESVSINRTYIYGEEDNELKPLDNIE